MTGHDDIHRVSVLAGDGIMLLGRNGLPQTAYIARLEADGAPDTTFGGGGFGDPLQFGSSNGLLDMADDAGGNPVAGGMYDTYTWIVVRWCGN